MHLAAITNNPEIIHALLVSPQGGPAQPDIFTRKTMLKKWVTFLCCLNRLGNDEQDNFTIPPQEVINHILSYSLPKPEEFINHVPLRHLPAYRPFMCTAYKERLIARLTKRHMNKCKNMLYTKVQVKRAALTPMQLAAGRGHVAAATLLDPRAIGNYKDEIESGYVRLLK